MNEETIKDLFGISPTRTKKQNASIHLFFRLLADELNANNLDMRKVLKPEVQIEWNEKAIKEYLWKPIQEACVAKKSTTELTTSEVNEIYEILNRHIGQKWGVHVEFPNEAMTENYLRSFKK
jgi:hypothetical protein